MRDLTKEELALAPDWATHYTKSGDQVTFFDEFKVQSSLNGGLDEVIYDNNYGIESADVKIPKKPFDISEYQSPSMREIDQPYIDCVDSELLIVIGKVDKGWAIAIAKALGVTGEDLL